MRCRVNSKDYRRIPTLIHKLQPKAAEAILGELGQVAFHRFTFGPALGV